MSKKSHGSHQHHDDRRQQFVTHKKSHRPASGTWLVIIAGVAFFAVTVYLILANSGGVSAGSPLVQAETLPTGQDVRLPLAQFADGQARFYRYTSSTGREIRLFVMKSSDGVVRAAFDACDVCYRERKGYHQAGNMMICNNCGKAFRSVDINVITGGCNPSPLKRTLDGDSLVLKATDLEQGAAYF